MYTPDILLFLPLHSEFAGAYSNISLFTQVLGLHGPTAGAVRSLPGCPASTLPTDPVLSPCPYIFLVGMLFVMC